jgi:hypothetical protein
MGTTETGGTGAKTAVGSLTLEFDKSRSNQAGSGEGSATSLSAIISIGNSIYAGGDEGVALIRLEAAGAGSTQFVEQEEIDLRAWFDLPTTKPDERDDKEKVSEVDLEGLAVGEGEHGRILWLVGSHSVKRENPKPKKSDPDNIEKLHDVGLDPNRLLLGYLPLDEKGKVSSTTKGKAKAAQLEPSIDGNPLLKALRKDPLLGAFVPDPEDFALADDTEHKGKDKNKNGKSKNGKKRVVAGKENGLDFEGLAVVNERRVLVGLRGPVLRGIAVLLELELQHAGSGEKADRLDLQPIGPTVDGEPTLYRRHFIDLAGNGVRDLCWDGKDLLILAGPTMSLDAPPCIFRWVGAAEQMNKPAGEAEYIHWRPVPKKKNGEQEEKKPGDVLQHRESYFTSWVQLDTGADHAESIGFRDGGSRELMIAYDAPGPDRHEEKSAAVSVDVVGLGTLP